MRKSFAALCLMCVLTPGLSAYASGKGDDLNRPIPLAARQLALRGTQLVDRDRVAEGLALLKSDFELEGIAGQKIKLSELKGKVVMLDFWATWCGPCLEEMPHLVELYEKYKERGFEVLAISVDSKSERYKVAPFVEAHKLTFPVLFDEGVAAPLYGVKVYPTTIFIDRQGNVCYVDAGFTADRPRVFDAVVSELLK